MKRLNLILIGASAVAVLLGLGLSAQQPSTKEASPFGTWQIVSGKYGPNLTPATFPKGERHIKIVTPTHFIWVNYDDQKRLITSSMGGTCSLQGDKYTETVEFYQPKGMQEYVGKKQEFSIRIEGDKLFQSGQLSDGLKIEEVWQRVKTAAN